LGHFRAANSKDPRSDQQNCEIGLMVVPMGGKPCAAEGQISMDGHKSIPKAV
jgi:hypothetical protein